MMDLPSRLKTKGSKPKAKENAAGAAKRAAQDAVDQYQEMVNDLREAEKSFRQEFPEAHEALEKMNEFKDEIAEQIDRAKILVRNAGVSIGDFKLTKKKSQPAYKPDDTRECLKNLVSRAVTELNDLDSMEDSAADMSWKDAHDRMEGVYILTHSLDGLLEAEVIKALPFDKDNAKLFMPANPHIADLYVEAWDPGGEELTPAVKVPKL